MSAEEGAAPVDMEGEDKGEDAENQSGDGEGEFDDGEAKQEYVKKEYVANLEYVSTTGALEEVEKSIIKASRPKLRMRVSRPRKEYGQEGFNFADKEASENSYDLKSLTKNIDYITKKKVLDMGLQAAYQMKRIQTQTVFGRSVNKAVQYSADDFIGNDDAKKVQDQTDEEKAAAKEFAEKLDKFLDRVAFRVEEALQSNEIINVFQDDFEMLGDDEAAAGGKVNTTTMNARTFIDNDFCKGKRVSCIKFHPTKPYWVAMSMIDNMEFETRALIQGKSFESYVLILNFSDNHIITLGHILETPIEISTIEFHPENSNVLTGGCLNGQVIVWDLSSTDHRIANGPKKGGEAGGEDEEFGAAAGGEDNEKTQNIVKMKHLCQSSIIASHKNFVADIAFVPSTINVDKRNPSGGKSTHFISISEDGIVNIWDTRLVDKEALKATPDYIWKPFLKLDLFKQDGSGELGLSRILLQKDQTTPTFWAASDEGDLVLVDWSVKPVSTGDDGPKFAEYVRFTYDSQKEHRPALALERSPFYPNLLLTVHNFNFSIWKTDLEDYNCPIFISAPTYGAHNTCGAFSPTRPGVIFIMKTNGIDVWDFLDQSNKPSLTFNFATSPFMYCKFQFFKHADAKQYMAYGDKENGTLFLYEVPTNIKNVQPDEEEHVEKFWQQEIKKCLFVVEQRERKKEEYAAIKSEKEKRLALAEAAKEISQDVLDQREFDEEESYQDMLLKKKAEFKLITDEELQALTAKKKKK